MLVSILKDTFDSLDEAKEDNLTKFWLNIFDRHKLFLIDEDDIDALMTSRWYSKLSNSSQDVIMNSITDSIQMVNPDKIAVKITQKNDDGFSIKEATEFLTQPFIIILENSKNDAPFFDCLLRCFPRESKQICEHKENRWLKYGMGGGSTIPHVIETELNSFEADIYVKPKHKYLRYFVLIDSDKTYKEEELKKEKIDLINFLDANEVQYHILEKREMENYLPDDGLKKIIDNLEYINAYCSLTQEQKDYFDIQKGFTKKFNNVSKEIKYLYHDVSDENIKFFERNNLEKINGSCRCNFKKDFPKLFDSISVTKENLLDITDQHQDPQELRNILKKVTKLL